LKPFDIRVLKKIGQHFNKASINDVVLGLISVAMKEYMSKKGDASKTMNMLIPYSLREIPKTAKEHKLCNDFSVLCFTLGLCE